MVIVVRWKLIAGQDEGLSVLPCFSYREHTPGYYD
jgi:hypothetical protein